MKGIVWLASYPKSGNTWFRVFLANLLQDAARPVDINRLPGKLFASRPWFDRVLGWESAELTEAELRVVRLDVQAACARAGGAVFKVHEAFAHPRDGQPLFSPPATRAVLYFVRHPLDVVVSYAHHRGESLEAIIARMNDPETTLATEPDLAARQLPQPIGHWSGHVRSWVDAPGLPLQVLRYEDLLAQPHARFGEACRFAGFPAEPARVARALEHARFETLQRQEEGGGFRESFRGNRFFRQGRAGGWREVLSPAQVAAIVQTHGDVMRRFGYLNADGTPA